MELATKNPVHDATDVESQHPSPTKRQSNDDNDNKKNPLRYKLYNLLHSLRFQSAVLFLVLVDVVILVLEELNPSKQTADYLDITVWIILTLFSLEIVLKFVILGKYLFIKDIFNVFDMIVVATSLVLNVITIFPGDSALFVALRGSRIFRVVRGIRGVRYLIRAVRSGEVAMRHAVGRNKMRYIDLENSFDLDLAYISQINKKSLIVMSVPAVGHVSLFRNPIWEVQRFLNSNHEGKWRIYNCCPELPYPPLKGGATIKYDIRDHSPPSMRNFVDFLNDASTFMRLGDGGNVLAIHCKGGKGRSGSLCCAWLLFTKECGTADEAMRRFGEMRTDFNKEGKIQGVETPSQKRYVHQIELLLKKQNLYFTYHIIFSTTNHGSSAH